jgi:hypothetical protein
VTALEIGVDERPADFDPTLAGRAIDAMEVAFEDLAFT